MSMLDVMRALRRHIAVVGLLLVVTAAAGYTVYWRVPVFYQSSAALVVLLPSVAPGADNQLVPVNPYQNIGALSAQVTASALASVAGSEEFQNQLKAEGVTSDTTVAVAPLYGGGVVLSLTSVNRVALAAERDLTTVNDQVSSELRRRQLAAGAPESALLTASELTSPTTPVALVSNRSKLAAVTAVIGVIVALVVVFLLERLGRRGPGDPVRVTPASGVPDGGHAEPIPAARTSNGSPIVRAGSLVSRSG